MVGNIYVQLCPVILLEWFPYHLSLYLYLLYLNLFVQRRGQKCDEYNDGVRGVFASEVEPASKIETMFPQFTLPGTDSEV